MASCWKWWVGKDKVRFPDPPYDFRVNQGIRQGRTPLGILQLIIQVCRLGNVLSDAGVVSGDVVALYMPVSPLAVATMLAASRLGAIHNVVFAGFSAEALAARVRDAGARVIVTADEAVSVSY